MRRFVVALLMLAAFGFAAPAASAGPVLFETAFSQDGTVYTALGRRRRTGTSLGSTQSPAWGRSPRRYAAPALHNILVFLDIEIDELVNTFFNEFGSVVGAPGAGLSWEIDEPGYVFGDIYTNFVAGALDGTNGVPSGSPDDVSFALGRALRVGRRRDRNAELQDQPHGPRGRVLPRPDRSR